MVRSKAIAPYSRRSSPFLIPQFIFDNSTPMATIEARIIDFMVIIKTSIFTRQVLALLSDEDYRRLQMALVLHPDMGAVIPGSGGLRKARCAVVGRGKRGGV
jgi:hypothetical protein